MGSSVRKKKVQNAYHDLEKNFRHLYSREGTQVFKAAKDINACKLNLGGGSRFLETHLEATRKSLLFSDIVLIPDPIMPWLEKKRDEEKYQHVFPLQMSFFVLHLSDLKDEDFDIPPFFIFPSWEKTLEEKDEQTINSSLQLIADIFAFYVDSGIQSFQDIIEYGEKNPESFLHKVDDAKLLISPGGQIGEPLDEAIENYKKEMKIWRSDEWVKKLFAMGNVRIVINAISERIQPHYHLIENSDELKSHPLLCVEAQAYYYRLIANMKNENIACAASFDPSTNAILNSLLSEKLDFLVNISDMQLIRLRKTKENVLFRKELRDLINSLSQTKLNDLGYVTSEVCSYIEAAISKHKRQVQAINDKYQAKHKQTAILSTGTLGVTLFPILAPFLSAVLPLGLATIAGKYVSDKFDESAEMKQLSRSMMGVISLSHDS